MTRCTSQCWAARWRTLPSGGGTGRASAPLLPLVHPGLFRNRGVRIASIVGLSFSFGMVRWIFLLIQFPRIVLGHPAPEAGVMSMPRTFAPMVFALSRRLDRARMLPR